ncbi:hypothetical protein [Streptomyces atroolivaceus]|uniref:hypothetical protein n=1 Tax=Streptomyces atroolivaceus TaxID=66869 RepID=UPI0020254D81|nr:hypothetical protein [Streptomyces atroolivaceus]
MPGFGLLFEVLDVVGVRVGGAGFLHGGFPAAPSFFGGELVCAASAFGGFSAERDLLCDLDELVFEGSAGGVCPLRGAVWAAAAEGEAQALGGGVAEARDAHPGVLFCVGALFVGGDVFAAVLFLEDEEADLFAVGGDGEVRLGFAAPLGRHGASGGAERHDVALLSGGGDEGLDDAQGSPLNGVGQPHGLGLLLECGHRGVGAGEPGGHGQ